ncbi:MAG: type II toxin-antitoxin system Phd/YefM family antitoxin [Mesorhizobium sp.]|nr:type II toxin-antitoxin system Phd/YefM family antitoxin [Mesorhizobium sp. M7A.F.Ca.ET.027.02.1.1]RWD03971.1 MAG: type II toxin-antitoxin system Phd/YefM family antitoxin [Mesorhizobium sp.]
MNWHLKDAKNNLSKLVRQAREQGPQTITVRGKPTAVVLSPEDYDRLVGATPSLAEYLLSGPVWDDDFVEEVNRRPKTKIRVIDLSSAYSCEPRSVNAAGAFLMAALAAVRGYRPIRQARCSRTGNETYRSYLLCVITNSLEPPSCATTSLEIRGCSSPNCASAP